VKLEITTVTRQDRKQDGHTEAQDDPNDAAHGLSNPFQPGHLKASCDQEEECGPAPGD
jgi:hypothetical protein